MEPCHAKNTVLPRRLGTHTWYNKLLHPGCSIIFNMLTGITSGSRLKATSLRIQILVQTPH